MQWIKSCWGVVLLLLILMLSGSKVCAATIVAGGVDFTSVQSAVSQASTGDTVQIPAGTATWSQTLAINKVIKLIGAGTNNTIINNSGGTLIQWRPGQDLPIRLSGIRIISPSATTTYIVVFTGKATQVRVDSCRFDRGDIAIAGNIGGPATGPFYGVIDHCIFYNCRRGVLVTDYEPSNDYDPTDGHNHAGKASWSRPIVPGTTNSLCIEDNNFYWDSNIGTDCYDCLVNTESQVYGQDGARATIRNNTFATARGGFIDAHGDDGDIYSTVLYEVYSNRFSSVTGGAANSGGTARGGMHIYFGNTFSGTAIPLLYIQYFQVNGTTVSINRVVTNTYFWNNVYNGSTDQSTMIAPWNIAQFCDGCSAANILLNRNFFLHAPQAGQNFYPYAPLVYPHPLISPSTNPISQVSPGGLTFALLPNGGSSNQTVTIRNIGLNTLAGSASISSTSSPSPWSIVGSSTYSLPANGTATITVRFTATASDNYATLNLNDNGGSPRVSLVGGPPKTYIWPLGDSITQGHDVPGGYRLPLYQMLTNAGINAAFVGNTNDNSAPGLPYPNHDGYGGYEIGDLAAGEPTWFANIPTPDIVLLMAGINDFRHNDDVQHATNRLENLIVQIATSAPSAKIIVADLNPWTNLQPTNAVMDLYYNPYIPGVVARQAGLGRKVYLCDMRGQLSASDLEADNTHPTQAGYNKIATSWNNSISQLVNGGSLVHPPPNFRIIATGR